MDDGVDTVLSQDKVTGCEGLSGHMCESGTHVACTVQIGQNTERQA